MSKHGDLRRAAVSAESREAQSTPRHGQEPEVKMLSMSELFHHLPNRLAARPNAQTHVIDGYVIQESLDPFAVGYVAKAVKAEPTSLPMDLDRPSATTPAPHSKARPQRDLAGSVASAATTRSTQTPAQDHTSASTTAPAPPPLLGLEASMSSDPNLAAMTRLVLAPLPAPIQIPAPIMVTPADPVPDPNTLKRMQVFLQQRPSILAPKKPIKWTVHDVAVYIRRLPGYAQYADEFRRQLIDGEALFLLNEQHLMDVMGMKLGPALKICDMIRELGEKK
ncbi:uncharacterized protein LOC144107256 [Amblyomma americanum]